ncbi:sensor histidine kinase [Streptococcus sp. 27098_8_23]|uniref:sensor histidine kinase n=1 Tax=Streptococcus TaxID=1301 RepID=UPI0008A44405|nr:MULTISPECIES: sensor histidine kinase [unclassified Streptococcus]OFL50019.1 histidine kinase [Streptococcus sp. HMSC076C08]OFP35299.1 histidine kinase [Streptococcus sp. HMSC072D07]
MKQNLKYLATYLPWLLVLLVFDLFTAILLWLSDVRMFQALILLYLLATVLLFFILSLLLIRKERKKSAAYKAFIANPKIDTELELLRLSTVSEKESLEEIANALYQKQAEIGKLNSLLADYEDYVEKWAHEIKLPLSLLSLLLDNQSDQLPKDTAFKLDYVKNQIQENVSQILFYYRVKSEKNDFLFEDVDLEECIQELLENFDPLLKEKKFTIKVENIQGICYTDQRSFEFILSQILANSLKYSSDKPELKISMSKDKGRTSLIIRDNGCGVKACDFPHIFEKGFTGDSGETRKKSTGMGLYLVKQLADALKIEITVKSEWMQGFEITLSI